MEEGHVVIVEEERPVSRMVNKKKFAATMSASFNVSKSMMQSRYAEVDPIEIEKKRTLKKIIFLVTIDVDIMKNLKRLIEYGSKALNEKTKNLFEEKATEIMDEDKQVELRALLSNIESSDPPSYPTLFSLLRLYVTSSEEKSYIDKISEELLNSFKLEEDIREVSQQLGAQREKKSKNKAVQESVDSLTKEIDLYENKIEQASHKLNETLVYNDELREKVDTLRRHRLLIDQVAIRLEEDIKAKQEEIERTIDNASQAYLQKNEVEEELRSLNHQADALKSKFYEKLGEVNVKIGEEKEFQSFILSKEKERRTLDQLEIAMIKNRRKLDEKLKNNEIMENEYNISAKKEEEIRIAFEEIERGIGVHKPQEVVEVFEDLALRVSNTEQNIADISSEIKGLDNRIKSLKDQLTSYNLKGVKYDKKGAEEAEILLSKLEREEKVRRQCKIQYRKLIEILKEHKEHIEKVFKSIGASEELLSKIRNNTFTEHNINEFIGLLEEHGMKLINKFSRLTAEQIKLEKGPTTDIEAEVEDLNNIVAYDNANIMKGQLEKVRSENVVPDELIETEVVLDKERPLTEDQFRQTAFTIFSSIKKKPYGGHHSMSPLPKRINSAKASKFNIGSSGAKIIKHSIV